MKKLHVGVMSLCILCCLGWTLNVFAAKEAAETQSKSLPGITSPFTVEGVEFQITSVKLERTWRRADNREVRPSSTTDMLLIVEFKITNKVEDKVFNELSKKILIHDENGRKENATQLETRCANSSCDYFTAGKWVFAVAASSRSFTLELPGDHKIKLDSLLKKENQK
jgi:hypothetical protein